MPTLADLQQPINRQAREYAATQATMAEVPYLYGYRQQVEGSVPGVSGRGSIQPDMAGGGNAAAAAQNTSVGNLPSGPVGGTIGGVTLGGAGTLPEPVGINASAMTGHVNELAAQYGDMVPEQFRQPQQYDHSKGEVDGEKRGGFGPQKPDQYGMVDTLSFFQNQLLSALPIPGIGLVTAAGNIANRMQNMSAVNGLRQQLGIPELAIGQYLGGLLGLNDYGSGFVGDVDIGGKSYGISRGGIMRDIFGRVTRTTLTPEEAFRRQEMARIAEERRKAEAAKRAAEDEARQRASQAEAQRAAENERRGGSAYGGPTGMDPGSTDLSDRGSYFDPSYSERLGVGVRANSWNDAVRGMSGGWGGNDRGNRGADSQGGGFGCFAAGTPILMADGSEKPIEAIRPGDAVASFGPDGALSAGRVVDVMEPYTASDMVRIGRMRVTARHRFLTPDGFQPIGQAREVVRVDGTAVPVEAMEARPERVFNFTVAPHHTYIAAGYRVHNIK